MRVLDIIDGILRGLLLGQLQIEIELAVGPPGQEDELRGIRADIFDDLPQGDELARSLRHRHALTTAHQIDDLYQDYYQTVLRVAKGLHRRLHAGNVAMMIGSPNIDQQVIAARQLVAMIGDIGCQIGKLSVLLPYNTILIVAEG